MTSTPTAPSRRLSRHAPLLGLLAAGLAWRLLLAFVVVPGQGYASDLGLYWQWATALADGGPGAFYGSTSSANYPPLYLYVLWLLGAIGEPGLIKLPAMLAEVGIAAVLYALASGWRGPRTGLVAAGLFLFLPVTWYDSAIWGQTEAIGTLLAVVAMLLLVRGWSEAALVAAVLALLVKPQFGIALVVVLPVLVGRHLLRPGSGPQPALGRVTGALDRALGGLFRQQGLLRLGTAVVAAGVVGLLAILPFDLGVYADPSVADLPVIGQAAGLLGLVGRLGSEFSVLTANAFNPWALAGSPSLAESMGTDRVAWIDDTLPVLGDLAPVTIGAAALALVGLMVAGGLLVRDGVVPILLGFTVLALAFFVLPTRVHERYLYPFFATASVLAAPSLLRIAGLAVLNGLAAVNLHAILAGHVVAQRPGGSGRGGGGGAPGAFGRFDSVDLPFGELARRPEVVTLVAVAVGVALVLLLAAWVLLVVRGPGASPPRVEATAGPG